MSAPALLDELARLGIHLVRDGDAIDADVEDGAELAHHTERIKANKPALLAELRKREALAAMESNPALRWVLVSTAPVEASLPPEGWDGQVPASCGVPNA